MILLSHQRHRKEFVGSVGRAVESQKLPTAVLQDLYRRQLPYFEMAAGQGATGGVKARGVLVRFSPATAPRRNVAVFVAPLRLWRGNCY
jgi:hypothetical protein